MITNAQAALAAAAQVYADSQGDVAPDNMTGMAYKFKRWLDRQDADDRAAASPAPVRYDQGMQPVRVGPRPAPPVGIPTKVENTY
jgi:hypothetical protein